MFLRLLWESFVRQRRRKALAGIAILLGTTAVTAMLALATTIGDRIHKELAVYGANIVVTPKAEQLAVKVGGIDIKPTTTGTYLKESDLNNLKTIFWANNITGVSPELDVAFTPHTNISRSTMYQSIWIGFSQGNLVRSKVWIVDHRCFRLASAGGNYQGTGPPGQQTFYLASQSRCEVAFGEPLSQYDLAIPYHPPPSGQTPRGIWMQGLVSGVVTTGGPEDAHGLA